MIVEIDSVCWLYRSRDFVFKHLLRLKQLYEIWPCSMLRSVYRLITFSIWTSFYFYRSKKSSITHILKKFENDNQPLLWLLLWLLLETRLLHDSSSLDPVARGIRMITATTSQADVPMLQHKLENQSETSSKHKWRQSILVKKETILNSNECNRSWGARICRQESIHWMIVLRSLAGGHVQYTRNVDENCNKWQAFLVCCVG